MRRRAASEDEACERISARVRAIAARSGIELPTTATRRDLLERLRSAGMKAADARKALDDATATGTTRTDRLLGVQDVRRMTDLGRTTLWKLSRTGEFPPPVRLSKNRIGWRASEVARWIKERRPTRG